MTRVKPFVILSSWTKFEKACSKIFHRRFCAGFPQRLALLLGASFYRGSDWICGLTSSWWWHSVAWACCASMPGWTSSWQWRDARRRRTKWHLLQPAQRHHQPMEKYNTGGEKLIGCGYSHSCWANLFCHAISHSELAAPRQSSTV